MMTRRPRCEIEARTFQGGCVSKDVYEFSALSFFFGCISLGVTLPEWLTGSPANKQIKRLGFARECSNRSGNVYFPHVKIRLA